MSAQTAFLIAAFFGIITIRQFIKDWRRQWFDSRINLDNEPQQDPIRRVEIISSGTPSEFANAVEHFINAHDCYCDVKFYEYHNGAYSAVIVYTENKTTE